MCCRFHDLGPNGNGAGRQRKRPDRCAAFSVGCVSGVPPSYAFYYVAPASANKAITVSVSGAANTISAFADEFAPPAGKTAAFDNDAAGGATSGASPITSPTVTAAAAGDLLYAYSGDPSSNNFTGVGGGWTRNDAGAGANGDEAEYILNSSSGGTAVNFTAGGSNTTNTIAMSFKVNGGTCVPSLTLLGVGAC